MIIRRRTKTQGCTQHKRPGLRASTKLRIETVNTAASAILDGYCAARGCEKMRNGRQPEHPQCVSPG
jgi:hypothetical protein